MPSKDNGVVQVVIASEASVKQDDSAKKAIAATLAMFDDFRKLHMGEEAEDVRSCMVASGLKKQADLWKKDVDTLMTSIDALALEFDKGVVNERTFRLLMQVMVKLSTATATFYDVMGTPKVLEAMRGKKCVDKFFRFLAVVFQQGSVAVKRTTKLMGPPHPRR